MPDATVPDGSTPRPSPRGGPTAAEFSSEEKRSGWGLAAGVIATALAGGMGWGIRGQYGHETGAMIAGVLMGFTLLLFWVPRASSLFAARGVALLAVGIAFGGSMTYGQTVGLTHDPELVGNWDALRWGLLGLFIKGGIWIGYAGAFFGMALSGKRYRLGEILGLVVLLTVLLFLGIRWLNGPFDPVNRVLPAIYFSDDWYWEPEKVLKPRPECWGGLLLGLAGLTAYVAIGRRDRLARNLALAGFLAGGIGFPVGQCLQAYHAWNLDQFRDGWLGRLDPYLNWWNLMEITFGTIAGAGLALGMAWNRPLVAGTDRSDEVLLPGWAEVLLLAVHLPLLITAEFLDGGWVNLYLQFGVFMSLIPLIGIWGGRYWPYWMALPIVATPIAGKTIREVVFREREWDPTLGWILLIAVPLGLLWLAATALAARKGAVPGRDRRSGHGFLGLGLLLATWCYFGWNWVFFRSPWPWQAWTGRTPSGLIFLTCALVLTGVVVWFSGKHLREAPAERTS